MTFSCALSWGTHWLQGSSRCVSMSLSQLEAPTQLLLQFLPAPCPLPAAQEEEDEEEEALCGPGQLCTCPSAQPIVLRSVTVAEIGTGDR